MPTVIDRTPIHDDAVGWSRGAIRYARGEVDPPHHHPQGQLLFATKGVMLVETGNKRWVIPPQRALWIPPLQEHTYNNLAPKERGIAMVFQNYALYPHMTVRENLAFGLKLSKLPKDQIESQVNEAAKILELEELLDRLPRQLSGGQAQRVAVGRAIVKKPDVFLFDEPLSNLDAKLRASMQVHQRQRHLLKR
jgi:energy-coupling factor transporter ATP-binding protein EcfA2